MSLDPKSSVVVPEDRFGLYAIDVLDPDMVCYISFTCIAYLGTGFTVEQLTASINFILFSFGYVIVYALFFKILFEALKIADKYYFIAKKRKVENAFREL